MKLSTYQNLLLPNFSVRALRQVLEEANLDWRSALRNAALDYEAVVSPGRVIPAPKELAFQLEFVALTRGRIDLWIKAAKAYTVGGFGVRGLAMVTAPTIEAWVTMTTKMDDGPGLAEVTPLHTPEGVLSGVQTTYPEAPEDLIPFSVYRDFVFIGRTIPWLYGGPFPFTRVEFPFAEISPEASKVVACRIDCGASALRMWWEPEASTQPLPFGDSFQHEAWVKADTKFLETIKADGDWPDAVAEAVRSAPVLNRDLTTVAETLGVSPRTLQRKLHESGRSFAQLRDQTLHELAQSLLEDPSWSISAIGRKLGYSAPASFSIAFKRWTGMSPITYRNADRYDNQG